MSRHQDERRRVTVPALRARKGGQRIVALTAYAAPMAALLDAHCDLLLVGDSLGMVIYGQTSTVGVTVDLMIAHGKAVADVATRALVTVDLPFGSYEAGPEQAFATAARIMAATGCQAVKLESHGGAERSIAFLVERGIPVVGHIGLRPQAVNVEGGFKAKGRTEAERRRVLDEARAAEQAGAFAIVVEGVAADLAAEITASVAVPTIGIGAGAGCDGQILVTEDMLGLFQRTPRFVRRYGEFAKAIDSAVAAYAGDVREGRFPGADETYAFKTELPAGKA